VGSAGAEEAADVIRCRLTTRYLLGRLDDAARERVERRLLADGAACDAVAAGEDELIDAYAAGELGGRDRQAFEALLAASPRLRERVAFARALGRLATAERAPAPRPAPRLALRFSLAAAALLAVAAGWLLARNLDLNHRLDRVAGEQRALSAERDSLARHGDALAGALASAQARASDLDQRLAEANETPPAHAAPLAVSFVLSAAVRSAGPVRELALPAAAVWVNLDVDLGGEETARAFLAVLTGPTGAEAWSQAGLPPTAGGTRVALRLPAAVLAPGHYALRVSAAPAGAQPELVGAYEFRIVRPERPERPEPGGTPR
jgi:hypothetical protein